MAIGIDDAQYQVSTVHDKAYSVPITASLVFYLFGEGLNAEVLDVRTDLKFCLLNYYKGDMACLSDSIR